SLTAGAVGVQVKVPVNIANPNPANSGGLTSAVIGINYDPGVFSAFVNSDPNQGPNVGEGLLNSGAGWSVFSANVKTDSGTGKESGQIIISTSDAGGAAPITSTAAGSLAIITFTVVGKPSTGTTSVVNLSGTNPATTALAV